MNIVRADLRGRDKPEGSLFDDGPRALGEIVNLTFHCEIMMSHVFFTFFDLCWKNKLNLFRPCLSNIARTNLKQHTHTHIDKHTHALYSRANERTIVFFLTATVLV